MVALTAALRRENEDDGGTTAQTKPFICPVWLQLDIEEAESTEKTEKAKTDLTRRTRLIAGLAS
jgi:hypothetical protein